MKRFKEWLSDNLRYFLLLAAVAVGIAAIVLGMRMYEAYRNTTREENSSPGTEKLSEGEAAIEILTEAETEQAASESVTENAAEQTETEQPAAPEQPETSKQTETAKPQTETS